MLSHQATGLGATFSRRSARPRDARVARYFAGSMRDARTARAWIWAALGLQLVGFAFDAVWHGLLSPGVEPTTFTEMLVHLGTVHLPLYLGVLSVLITTGWALVERRSGSAIAFAGALISTVAEAWHASIHLRLSTRGGPIAEGVAMVGFVTVVIAVWVRGSQERHRLASTRTPRSAA
jgi:hypothetical protein